MNKVNNIAFFFVLYFSLLTGFYFDENLNFGSYYDWINVYVPPIKDFSENFGETLLNYDQYGQRHSPIFIILLSFLFKIGISFDVIRIINLHLSLSLIFIFYNSLKIIFKNIDKSKLQLLSLVIFLSPTFRSLSIWPDSRLPGLIFFVLSIYFFIKLLKDEKTKNAWLCSISLLLSAYISPNFSLFAFYFYPIFFLKIKTSEFLKIVFLNFILSLPMFYYLFYLDVNFLVAGNTPGYIDGESTNVNFNISNKILIISSIILFHLIPIIINYLSFQKILKFYKKNFVIILSILIVLVVFFDYQLNFTGGGVFFQFSQLFFGNNYIFYFICFFAISMIYLVSKKSIHNFYLFIIIVASNVQNTIYHKYYEPLILILFFLLVKNIETEKFFKNNINFIYLYLLSIIYISMRLYKIYFIV